MCVCVCAALSAKKKVQMGHLEEIVAAWFKQQTGKEIHRSVVVKAVSAGFHELVLESPDYKRRKRPSPNWPLLDKGLYLWFSSNRSNATHRRLK